jgi:glycosyltransferase involved in cell wall biosynthesis
MKLRIAEVHIPWQKIPVTKYGGSERVVYPLIEGLIKQGHEVTLFAAGNSQTSAKLVSVYPTSMTEDGIARKNIIYPLLNILEAAETEKQFDILHFHLNVAEDFAALPLTKDIKQKVVFTVHFTAPVKKEFADRETFLRRYAGLNYISISNSQRKGMEYLNWIKTVYNAVDTTFLHFNNKPEDYFFWMGKFNPDKGTKIAVEAAKKAGVNLLLAGAVDKLDSVDYAYYHEEIKPLIDGKQIKYIGEIDDEQKNKYLGNAVGFLNPIIWNEPFGMVMAESLACGTPVISFDKGAAPELIENNKTGYIVKDVDGMVEKIKQIKNIDRKKCRERAETLFSSDALVTNYLAVFKNILDKNI